MKKSGRKCDGELLTPALWETGFSLTRIAEELNRCAYLTPDGRSWDQAAVLEVLVAAGYLPKEEADRLVHQKKSISLAWQQKKLAARLSRLARQKRQEAETARQNRKAARLVRQQEKLAARLAHQKKQEAARQQEKLVMDREEANRILLENEKQEHKRLLHDLEECSRIADEARKNHAKITPQEIIERREKRQVARNQKAIERRKKAQIERQRQQKEESNRVNRQIVKLRRKKLAAETIGHKLHLRTSEVQRRIRWLAKTGQLPDDDRWLGRKPGRVSLTPTQQVARWKALDEQIIELCRSGMPMEEIRSRIRLGKPSFYRRLQWLGNTGRLDVT